MFDCGFFKRRRFLATFLAGCALAIAHEVAANPRSSDELSPALLDACDRQAAPFGKYAPAIAAAVNDLTAMGVFTDEEFREVSIGFCALRAAGGPAATASCARDTILLDAGYESGDRRLVRNATLAHEMKHHLQHQAQKSAFGKAYCTSERYRADHAWMEPDADAFGDSVGELFLIGRPVELRNDCPAAVSVYLEPDLPASALTEQRFLEVAPQSEAALAAHSLTKSFKLYAESAPLDGRQWFWRASDKAHLRFVDGKPYALKSINLPNPSRAKGSFRLHLTCPPDRATTVDQRPDRPRQRP